MSVMMYSYGEWTPTGRTRYAMRGIWPFRKPALQLEETTILTEICTIDCSERESGARRWRFANAADRKNGVREPDLSTLKAKED